MQPVLAAVTSSQIYTISSMQEIEKYVDKETLVLFDLDHTVFEGKHYWYGHANWFYDQIEEAKKLCIKEDEIIEKIFPHWLYSEESNSVKPVEEITPKIIKRLQKKGIKVLGLTSRQVPLVNISLKHLASIDVDFNSPDLPKKMISIPFDQPTIMKNGTIFCSDYNEKGKVLQAYLNKLQIYPKKIVFIDDGLRNIQSVMNAFSQQTVVIGLYYPLVAERKKKDWDSSIARQEYYSAYIKNAKLPPFFWERKARCVREVVASEFI